METPNQGAPTNAPNQDPSQKEASQARRCFSNLERLTQQLSAYPPGHPAIENAIKAVTGTLKELFKNTDRLSVEVHPHSFVLYGTEEEVWETEEPRDFCFLLSRDGIFLFHFLAGIDDAEIKRFAEVLNFLIDNRNDPSIDSNAILFEASFSYIAYEALDESLAALAGIDLDVRNRDTPQEKEAIEDLFNDAFEKDKDEGDGDNVAGEYQINVANPAERLRKIDVGSREFLSLEDDAKSKLMNLRKGFTEHRELEHREGEILSAILGAKPKPTLRIQAVEQIGEVMGALLKTKQPWEALSFLKLIHAWRDRFGPEVAQELKDVVAGCFTRRRNQELIRQLVRSEPRERRMILQMFNALHLESTSEDLARVLGWEIDEGARADVLRYLQERAKYGFGFLEDTLPEIPYEHAEPLFELLQRGMPHSRKALLNVITADVTPDMKARALEAMHGHWGDPLEIRDVLAPLVKANSTDVRVAAARSVVEATPQHTVRVLGPLFGPDLRGRPEEEVRELTHLLVTKGGPQGVEKLRGLIQIRGLTSTEAERELAITVARALVRSPIPPVVKLLDDIANDWRVTGRIRNTCKEIVGMMKMGT
jgi:hypothetical protein